MGTSSRDEKEAAGSRAARQGARLERDLASHGSIVVALSGGVDSAVVAALAWRALGTRALAVTAAAETLARRELAQAGQIAAEIGIRHRVVAHSELSVADFIENSPNRCYVCQGLRMDLLLAIARSEGYAVVADGTNASDQGVDRPGLRAIRERGIFSPLLKHGLEKSEVRALARWLGLSVWDRPANACLSSRIPHGQLVTLTKLSRVERAEEILLERHFRQVRVRLEGETARVEVGPEEVERLRETWSQIATALERVGLKGARFDPGGYRYGGADQMGDVARGGNRRAR